MSTPQPGIYALGTSAHHHLQFDLDGSPDGLGDRLRDLLDHATSVAGLNLVIGFGSNLWSGLRPGDVPAGVIPFEAKGDPDGALLPAAQHDLWLWIHGSAADSGFDLARAAVKALDGFAQLTAEQVSFTYRASQDLTGFEDGTENPPLHLASQVATVPAGQPGAGSSVAIVQRWVHDLDAFEALAHDDREQVIGRTLVGSEEIAEDQRSERAHISRVVIEDDAGEELEIFRRSTAFGDVQEHGLMFIGFAADHARLDRMLDRMVGAGDGVVDNLMDISTCHGSAWYVVPPLEALAAF